MGINGKPVALIAGGSRGVGRAVALLLARNGYDLALVARSHETLKACAAECTALGAMVQIFPFDLQKVEDIEGLLAQIETGFGRIDALVNAAGFGAAGPISKAGLADFDLSIALNLRAIVHLTTHAIPFIKKSTTGAIIQIASRASRVPRPGLSSYSASKHGLIGFTAALFEEVRGFGIKVSSICPGTIDTDMIASRKLDPRFLLKPEDVADAVLFVLQFNARGCPTEIMLLPQREA